jgi:hypothetical protein
VARLLNFLCMFKFLHAQGLIRVPTEFCSMQHVQVRYMQLGLGYGRCLLKCVRVGMMKCEKEICAEMQCESETNEMLLRAYFYVCE